MPVEPSRPGEDRRQSPRVPVNGRVQARIVTLHLDVEMRDISTGGFLIASPVDIASGDVHVFEVALEDGRTCTLRARALHCRAPHGDEPAYLSGWRAATDESTADGILDILETLTGDVVPALPVAGTRRSRAMTVAWQIVIGVHGAPVEAGWAVICAEVRYASVRWRSAGEIERRHAGGPLWRLVAAELEAASVDGTLAGDSMTGGLLLPETLRGSCELRLHARPEFTCVGRDALVEALDHHLWALPDLASEQKALV
jgi:hypothetical protein